MTHRPAPGSPGPAPVPAIPARLEPAAIGVTQDTVIGLASSAPAATVGLTLAASSTRRRTTVQTAWIVVNEGEAERPVTRSHSP